MKNLSVLLLLFALFACSSKKNNEVVFKGHLKNYNSTYFLVSLDGEVDTIAVKEDGYFETQFNVKHNTTVFYKAEKLAGSLSLIPGFDLEIALDANKPDQSLLFVNNNACVKANKYLTEKRALANQLKIDKKDYFLMAEVDFIAKTEENFSKKNDLRQNFLNISKNEVLTFGKEETATLKYEKLQNYLRYETYHGKYIGDRDFKASDNLKNKLAQEDLNAGELFNINAYKQYIDERVNWLSREYYLNHPELKEKTNGYDIANFTVLKNLIHNTKIMNFLAYKMTLKRVSSGIDGAEYTLEKFKKLCSDSVYRKTVNKKVAKWEKLNPGKMAPDFTGKTPDGKTISLSDLKGKYVYVDVWATWCGPCRGEIPYLEKLEKEYHGKNITFLSVSIDKDAEKWRKMVDEKHLKGVQINVGSSSSLNKDYMIIGIPHFMLFDPEGKIVKIYAPRPSSNNIREVLNRLKNL